jgi:hypothetical protein
MTRTTTALHAALLAAVTLLAAAPAHAGTARHVPGNHLFLTLTRGDARSHDTSGTLLLCDPPQGHTHARRACAELAAAGGDIDRIAQRDTYCPMVYAPVTAAARGEWDGHRVAYERTFPNRCVLDARTGAVFAFTDDLPELPDRPVPGLPQGPVPGLH